MEIIFKLYSILFLIYIKIIFKLYKFCFDITGAIPINEIYQVFLEYYLYYSLPHELSVSYGFSF